MKQTLRRSLAREAFSRNKSLELLPNEAFRLRRPCRESRLAILLAMKLSILVCCALTAFAGEVPYRQSAFSPDGGGRPAGWTTWAARSEIAPKTYVDPIESRGEPGSLAISGNSNPAEYGGWEYTVRGIEPNNWYRFSAYYKAHGLEYEPLQVVARLSWSSVDGSRAGRPDYPYRVSRDGNWARLSMDVQAPEKAASVTLQLYLQNAPQATVWWDDVSVEKIPDPKPRKVTIATVNYRPGEKTGSSAETVRRFIETTDRVVPAGTDLILLPEGVTVVDTGRTIAEVAEPIPGPVTERLGELAKRKRSYLVAGVYEREGPAVYNTAVLIDRGGRVAGKYRKVFIPGKRSKAGSLPGTITLSFARILATSAL